jgi:hypothetical protein
MFGIRVTCSSYPLFPETITVPLFSLTHKLWHIVFIAFTLCHRGHYIPLFLQVIRTSITLQRLAALHATLKIRRSNLAMDTGCQWILYSSVYSLRFWVPEFDYLVLPSDCSDNMKLIIHINIAIIPVHNDD